MLGGRYQVESVFADSGGMGLLYRARDTRCAGNEVLIKTTRYDGGEHARHFRYTRDEAVTHIEATRKILAWEKKVLARFRGEGLNNLPSPNDFFVAPSVTLERGYEGSHGAFELPAAVLASEPYLVLEKIHGEVLSDVMRDEAWRRNLEHRLLIMSRELLTVFIKMHKSFEVNGRKACFIYQDLKPANILVSATDYFTLIDFGAVTLRLGDRTTEPTAGCITAGYAAPEASHGREAQIDPRFDLYTLGVTLWEAVTLRDPQELGEDFPTFPVEAMRASGVSSEFMRVVSRALQRDPAQRYPMAAAMRKDVMDLLRQRSA